MADQSAISPFLGGMSCHDISWPVSTSSLSSYDITEQVLCPLININVQHLPQHLPSVPRASAPPRENEVRAWSLRGSKLLIVSSLQYLTMPAIRPQSQPANARCMPRISVGHDFWLSVRRYYLTIPTVNPWSTSRMSIHTYLTWLAINGKANLRRNCDMTFICDMSHACVT